MKQKGKKIAKLIEDRLQTYQQEKSVLTAKISRLNKKMSIAAAPTGVSRWVQFSTFDQLHGTCDVLLSELLKQTQKNSDLSKENKRLKTDSDDLLSQCMLFIGVFIFSEGGREKDSFLAFSFIN